MGTHKLLVEVPDGRHFVEDRCANCLAELSTDSPSLFCDTGCREIAGTARYFRRVSRDGRINDPDVQYAVQIRLALLPIGGYAALQRALPPQTRRDVFESDQGRCRECGADGTEIDHIDGGSADLANLQLLCHECHRKKTELSLVPAPAEQDIVVKLFMLTRIFSDVPVLLADDQDQWQSIEARLRRERRGRLAAAREPDRAAANDETALIDDGNGGLISSPSLSRLWTEGHEDPNFVRYKGEFYPLSTPPKHPPTPDPPATRTDSRARRSR